MCSSRSACFDGEIALSFSPGRSGAGTYTSLPHSLQMQRFFISSVGTEMRLRAILSTLVAGVGLGDGVSCITSDFGNYVMLLMGLFVNALGALHTLFCHCYHLGISVALREKKIQGKI